MKKINKKADTTEDLTPNQKPKIARNSAMNKPTYDPDGHLVRRDKDEEDLTPKEKEIIIDLVYRTKTNENEGKGNTLTGYIIGLIVIIVVILIFIVGLCCYNRYAMKINIAQTQEF